MNTISSSNSVISTGLSFGGDDGGCTPGPFPQPRKPNPLPPIRDGVEPYAAHSGGTITCPEGTTPSVREKGQTVGVGCGSDGSGGDLKGPGKEGPQAPIL
jgi:hypothetical protein